jgi:uncharacterized protein YebE (UPF0316 family)
MSFWLASIIESFNALWFDWSGLHPALIALLIFLLRSIDIAIATLRLLAAVHGYKLFAWFAGFAQALVFIIAIASVLANLNTPWTIAAFAAGFATGSGLGITIERRLLPEHEQLRISSSHLGEAILEILHANDLGATLIPASGKQGTVSYIQCNVPSKRVPTVMRLVIDVDPQAFITVGHVRSLRGGWNA